MINKTLALGAYCLRWLAWAVHCLIICPAGTLVLIFALLLCLSDSTPGKVVVGFLQQADSITDGQRWTWRECTKKTPAKRSPSVEYPGSIGSFQQEECPEVVSDARGYAAYVDRTLLRILTCLWVLMGLAYGGLAWLPGHKPYFPRHVFIKTENGRGYIRGACASSQPVNESDKWSENEGEKR